MSKVHVSVDFGEEGTRDEEQLRSTSKISSSRHGHGNNCKMTSPFISRSVRAKRRRAFLSTYQLSSLDNNSVVRAESNGINYSEKLRYAAIKFKSMMVSVADAARLALLRRSCSFRPAICACVAVN